MPVLPLFPLPVVLFPGSLMPLHIFEPRYRALLADAAEGSHRFVILPPGEGGEPPPVGAIGTIARIRAIQPLPDGRSNVVISGEERITLDGLTESDRPYLVGRVTVLEDLPETQIPTEADTAEIRRLAERYAAALGTIAEVDREPDLAEDPGTMSFQVAALIEWELEVKQQFLSIRSVRERMARLLHGLPALVGEIEQRAAIHRRAGGNGKGTDH